MEFSKESSQLILKNFELDMGEEPVSEERLIELLSKRIEYLLESRTEYLFSLMYRLDIDESRVAFALSPVSDDKPTIALAKLVVERQKQRNYTKKHVKSKPISDEDYWEF